MLGKPGSGKSQHAVRLALGFAAKPGCYIVAHDVGWRLPETLHDGTRTGIQRHESVKEAAGAFGDPRRARGIHCVPSESAADCVQLAEALAEASLEAHGGESGYPSLVLIDEVVAAQMCDPNKLAPAMRHLLTLRRHKNVGLLWTCQSARMVHNQLLTLATELYVFRLTDKRDLDRLREAGVEEGLVQQVSKLPPYKSVRIVL